MSLRQVVTRVTDREMRSRLVTVIERFNSHGEAAAAISDVLQEMFDEARARLAELEAEAAELESKGAREQGAGEQGKDAYHAALQAVEEQRTRVEELGRAWEAFRESGQAPTAEELRKILESGSLALG